MRITTKKSVGAAWQMKMEKLHFCFIYAMINFQNLHMRNITIPTAQIMSLLQSAGPIREWTAQPQNVDQLIAAMYREMDL